MASSPLQRTIATGNHEQPSSLFQPTIADTHKMTGLGPLLHELPTEVRFMIFGDCIAAGHPEFMRASRALQNDGKAIITRTGVYRMRFGSLENNNGHPPCLEMTKEIQNLDINVDMTDWWGNRHQGWDCLEPFADAQIRREHCNIILKVDCAEAINDRIELIRIFWRFKGFKRVGLRIEVDQGLGHLAPCICMPRRAKAGVEWMHEFFASILGETELINVEHFFCMTFDPWDQIRTVAGGLEE